MPKLRVGTRASLLALTQTRLFIDSLTSAVPDLEIEEVHIQTQGDVSTEPLSLSKTPGIFVSALRDALLAGKVDFIVHSMKDLPAAPFPGITTACIPVREDARDGLVSRDRLRLTELSPGALVGTSSPRRAASIRAVRPDLRIESIRGNIDTRIAKVQRGEYDATLLAMAGLGRIGRTDVVCEIFPTDHLVPAAGQGALSIECLESAPEVVALLAHLDDAQTRLTTTAERSVLLGLSAGCSTAIGSTASVLQGRLILTAELAVEHTGEAFRVEKSVHGATLDQAHDLGMRVAAELRADPISREVAWA